MERQHPGGGWSYEPASTQAALEPTCLALLALRWDSSPARARGLQFLLGAQNPNGSWPAFSGDDQEGSGLTALAVIALINSGEIGSPNRAWPQMAAEFKRERVTLAVEMEVSHLGYPRAF